MQTLNKVLQEDIAAVLADASIPWSDLDGKTVLISGATGLIGGGLTTALLAYGETVSAPPTVVALVRNTDKARQMFGDHPALRLVRWSSGDTPDWDGDADYILHCASQTSSKGFVEEPVQTIRTAYEGTEALLRYAAEKQSAGFLFLSTMEVYGTPQTDDKVGEDYIGLIDPLTVRNCYPESKRLCECLCAAYAKQYGLPAFVARLTQTFGPGVQPQDRRVFAEFARCVMEQRDIVLHTKGETKRNYLYTADAVRALLLIALRGAAGQAYNVANESTYCSIYEMATLVAEKVADGAIAVRCEIAEDTAKFGYAPVLHMNLDTQKLCALGWRPQQDLESMFRRMMMGFEEK